MIQILFIASGLLFMAFNTNHAFADDCSGKGDFYCTRNSDCEWSAKKGCVVKKKSSSSKKRRR